MALALHAAGDGVVPQGFFLVACLQQARVAFHEVADDHHGLHGELPVGIFLGAVLAFALAVEGGHGCAGEQRAVLVVVVAFLGLAVALHPIHGAAEFFLVVDSEVHAAEDLHERDVLCSHSQILLQEIGIDDAAGDAHAGVPHGEVALAAHGSHSLSRAGEAQDLLCHVGGNGVVVEVLYVVAIDAEGGQSFLGVSRQHGRQVHGARTFCSVEAPYGFGIMGIHIHGLGTVAPAGSHGDGGSYAFALEFLGAGSTLGYSTDGGVCDDAFHGAAVAIAQVGFYQPFYGLGQGHGFLFKTLADAALATVDGGTDSDFRVIRHK